MTLGIIGGCGPLVGAHFLQTLFSMTEAAGDCDYPDLLLASLSSTPDRTAHILDPLAPDPTPALLAAARTLVRGGADLLLLLCHTAHAYLPTLRAALSVPVLDLVSIGVSFAFRAGVRRLGVLSSEGSVKAGVFEMAAAPFGIEILYPRAACRAALSDLIYRRLKSGEDAGEGGALFTASDELRAAGADALLLGCTELSLPAAAPSEPLALPVIDPLVLLAHRALSLCGKKIKEAYRYDAAWRPALVPLSRAFAFAPVGGDNRAFL